MGQRPYPSSLGGVYQPVKGWKEPLSQKIPNPTTVSQPFTHRSFRESAQGICMTVVLLRDCTGSEKQEMMSFRHRNGLGATRWSRWEVEGVRVYLVGSKLHSGFAFDQSGINLHNDRLYRIGTAPALKTIRQTVNVAFHDSSPQQLTLYLFSEKLHAQGPSP